MEKAFRVFKMFPQTHIFHRLPKHYKNQLIHMIEDQPTPVHYIPEPKEWIKHPKTGLPKRVINVPLPLKFPKEADKGIWGGEGVLQGYKKSTNPKKRYAPREPTWWFPVLRRSVVYSEILDKHLSLIVTLRTLDLIDENFGFDFYILKTKQLDLRSRLAMDLKRQMLSALVNKTLYPDNPEKQAEVYEKYKEFIIPLEEIEWLGLTLTEAFQKQKAIEKVQALSDRPLKIKYRRELISSLKEMKSKGESEGNLQYKGDDSWLQKFNPFSKSEEAPKS